MIYPCGMMTCIMLLDSSVSHLHLFQPRRADQMSGHHRVASNQHNNPMYDYDNSIPPITNHLSRIIPMVFRVSPQGIEEAQKHSCIQGKYGIADRIQKPKVQL
jgi:hypothetical protein